MRESEEMENAKDLRNALEQRLSNVQKDKRLAILEVFDAQTIVKLQGGEASAGKIRHDIPEGAVEDWYPQMRTTLICYCEDETYPGICIQFRTSTDTK